MTIEEQARSLQDYETAVSFVSNHRYLLAESESKILDLEKQVSWLKKQLFGQKSAEENP